MNVRVFLVFGAAMLALTLVGGNAFATPYSDAVQLDNPVVYYQFDEAAGSTTAANSGSGGAVYDTPSTGTAAPTFGNASANPNMGTAVDLGTGNGRFDMPNGGGAANYGTFLNVDNASLEFWINTTQTDDGGGGGWNQPTLMGDDNGGCCGGGGSDSWWGVLDNNGTPGQNNIGMNTQNNPIDVKSTSVINDGLWHHVVMTRGPNSPANNVDVWIDGNLEATGALLVAPNNTYNTIGAPEDNINTQHLDALIDEVAIYQFQLSSTQIADHFNAAFAAAVPEPSTCGLAVLALLGLSLFGWRRRSR